MQHSVAFNENSSTEKDVKELSETTMIEKDDLSETATIDDSDLMYVVYEKVKSNRQGQNATIYRNPSANDEKVIRAGASNPSCTIKETATEKSYLTDANAENTNTTT